MTKIVLPARLDLWERVHGFLEENLNRLNCSEKASVQVLIAAEEIYANIARYAYQKEEGTVCVEVEKLKDTGQMKITFTDSGIPYNPLKQEKPDITLSAEERQIGGLGIYIVKKMMDDVSYRYEDGKNILTISKYEEGGTTMKRKESERCYE